VSCSCCCEKRFYDCAAIFWRFSFHATTKENRKIKGKYWATTSTVISESANLFVWIYSFLEDNLIIGARRLKLINARFCFAVLGALESCKIQNRNFFSPKNNNRGEPIERNSWINSQIKQHLNNYLRKRREVSERFMVQMLFSLCSWTENELMMLWVDAFDLFHRKNSRLIIDHKS
jgi:hypothetical protein